MYTQQDTSCPKEYLSLSLWYTKFDNDDVKTNGQNRRDKVSI